MKRTYICFCCILLLLLTGCQQTNIVHTVTKLQEPAGTNGGIETVARRDLYQMEYAKGEVIPFLQPIYTETNSTFLSMEVSLGETVTKGQVLYQIKDLAPFGGVDVYHNKTAYETSLSQIKDEITKIETVLKSPETDKYTAEFNQLLLEQAKKKQEELSVKYQEILSLLENAKEEQIQVVAPIDGVVASIAELEEGAQIEAYQSVCILADTTKKFIVCSDEAFTNQTSTAIDYLQKNGELLALSKYEGNTSKQIAYETPAEDIAIGDMVMICRKYDVLEQALSVSMDALYQDDAGYYVYQYKEGTQVRQDVTIGTKYTRYVEIIDGIEEGAEVYVQN